MKSFVLHVAAVLSMALLAPTAVRADAASEAALQFELGRELYGQRRYAEALERFVASNRLVPNAGVMFNIAQTYQLLRRHREAFNWYETYLQQELSEDDRREGTTARDRLLPRVAVVAVTTDPPGAALYVDRRDLGSVGQAPRQVAVSEGNRTMIAELDGHHPAEASVEAVRGEVVPVTLVLRPVTGRLTVTSVPVRAMVSVDDEEVGRSPLSLELPAGRHRVELASPGFLSWTREVTIRDAETAELTVTMERAASRVAVLTVSGGPRGATVLIDGEAVGVVPLTLGDLEPGSRQVRIEHPGHDPWDGELALEPGGATRVDVDLVETGEGAATWRFGAYAAGGALLLAGAITGSLALARRARFFDSEDPERSDLDRVTRLNRLTDVLLVLGGVTLGVTLIFDFSRERPQSRGDVSIDR